MKRVALRRLAWSSGLALILGLVACQSSPGWKPAVDTAGSAGAPELDMAGGGSQSAASGGVSTGRGGTDGQWGGSGGHTNAGAAHGAGADGAGADGAGAGGVGSQGCEAESVGDLEVHLSSTSWDPLGYPPYAFDACTLVYVATGSDPGTLRVRDLATGEDAVLESAARKPRRPSISGPVIAWEADGESGSQVRVRFAGNVATLSGTFVRAAEPRVTDDAVVFTAFSGPNANDDSDVYLFDVVKGQLSVIAGGPGQQRFADVSPTHVAITDFSEDPQGYFNEATSIADVALIERATGMRSNRVLPGKQAFPLLGANDVFAYLEWGAVHPEPKLGQFSLKVGYLHRPVTEDFNVKTTGQVRTNPAYVRPSLRGSNLDFIDQGPEGAALYRVLLGTEGSLVSLKIAGSQQLFGPVAGERFTLLANQRSPQSFTLLAVPR